MTIAKCKVVRRTFEAAKHPEHSARREELNLDWRTSEYMPSYRYGVEDTPFLYTTKSAAVAKAAALDLGL